jgi:hypothetical protein
MMPTGASMCDVDSKRRLLISGRVIESRFTRCNKGLDVVGKGKRPRGIQGIKCIASGSGSPQAATFQEQYVDGPETDFTLECPCRDHDFTHELPMQELFDALGRKLPLLGLGGGSGFIELDAADLQNLNVLSCLLRGDEQN